jgi:TIR domain
MSIKFSLGGRKVSQDKFFKGVEEEMLEQIMSAIANELHGKAASVVDPETGKHVPVFVRRVGKEGWTIYCNGSPAFASALEKRLGLDKGEVHRMNEPAKRERLVYLAHASEDKAIVKPLAEGLMQRGIQVWYDNWEIGYGDSLRRKMEEGLGDCTHFVVMLTETSINKPWVNEEIDAGLMGSVEGSAKFIGLRYKLPLASVSPFLKTRLTPEFTPGDLGIDALAGEIFGISKKPPLGGHPRYVQSHEAGSSWSTSARNVAEYFVRKSENGWSMDPQASYADIQLETGLPMPDVRIGVLDLIGAGLLEKQEYFGGEGHIWPKADLFVTFDADFMDWDPEKDARDLAVHLTNLDCDQADASEAGQALAWEPRRFNAAAAYLVSAKIVEPIEHMGGDAYWPCGFMMGDELLRFVRSF